MTVGPHLTEGAALGSACALVAESFLRSRRIHPFFAKFLVLMAVTVTAELALKSHFISDGFPHSEYFQMEWGCLAGVLFFEALVVLALAFHFMSPCFSKVGLACIFVGMFCAAVPDIILVGGGISQLLFDWQPGWAVAFTAFHHSQHVAEPSYGIWNQIAISFGSMLVFWQINSRRLALARRRFSFE